jgi:hypothetical protein
MQDIPWVQLFFAIAPIVSGVIGCLFWVARLVTRTILQSISDLKNEVQKNGKETNEKFELIQSDIQATKLRVQKLELVKRKKMNGAQRHEEA